MQALTIRIGFFVLLLAALLASVSAEDVLFDCDAASPHSLLPLDVTLRETPAREAATYLGYALQDANVLSCTPQGFAGRGDYRNSIDLDELLIRFDQVLTPFAIIYACQEFAGGDAATPCATPHMSGPRAETTTRTASVLGTWPSDTFCCMSPAPADSPNLFNPPIRTEQTVPVPSMLSVLLFNIIFSDRPTGDVARDVVTHAEQTMERFDECCRRSGETRLEEPRVGSPPSVVKTRY